MEAPLDQLLTAQNIEWRDRARDVARRVVLPNAWKYDRLQEYPWEIKNALAEAGLMSTWIPKEYGGSGGGVLESVAQALVPEHVAA